MWEPSAQLVTSWGGECLVFILVTVWMVELSTKNIILFPCFPTITRRYVRLVHWCWHLNLSSHYLIKFFFLSSSCLFNATQRSVQMSTILVRFVCDEGLQLITGKLLLIVCHNRNVIKNLTFCDWAGNFHWVQQLCFPSPALATKGELVGTE